jgi:hypothetical protein
MLADNTIQAVVAVLVPQEQTQPISQMAELGWRTILLESLTSGRVVAVVHRTLLALVATVAMAAVVVVR